MTKPVAVLSRIHRAFGPVRALRGADLTLRAGEVHGVVGGNGAGKSTLFNVLAGRLRPDGGSIFIRGAEVSMSSPRVARALGVGMVHQHFTLVPTLTVLENLALSEAGQGAVRLDLERARSSAAELSDRTGLAVDLDAPVEALDVGDKQRAEILKALLADPALLVLDEPTAVLTPQEVDGLFDLLRSIAAGGCAVAIVAHKLDEVLAVSDHVTVLRDGETVLSGATHELDREELVRAMIGASEPLARVADRESAPTSGEAVLDLAGVSSSTQAGRLQDVTLSARRGEIVGITGVDGNGQHALALLLAGHLRDHAGSLARQSGVGYIPQDRSEDGVIGSFDLVENVALPRAGSGGAIRMPWTELREEAESVRGRFSVAAPSVRTLAGQLSGGNQQRVIVGREIRLATDLLVAENPTRGLDIAAAAFVHAELRSLARSDPAPAVVLISTDLDEVDALSDRIFVMSRGRLVPVPDGDRSREGIGRLMLGAARD